MGMKHRDMHDEWSIALVAMRPKFVFIFECIMLLIQDNQPVIVY